jgi:signal transduction histidine kinase
MRRIRIALLLLALALLAPIGLLTWRALSGLAYERAVRHQAVAERAFEEMERTLSEFLAREEARPSSQWGFYLAESGERSPLARPFAEPFVVGAFEIDADGRVRTPLEPHDGELDRALARGDWPPPPEIRRAIESIVAAVDQGYPPQQEGLEAADAERRDAAKAALAKQPPQKLARAEAQPPGTTRPLADSAPAPGAGEKDAETAYDVLQSFNTAARQRAERKQKIDLEPLEQEQLRAPGYATSGEAAGAAPAPSRASADAAGDDRVREWKEAAPQALEEQIAEEQIAEEPALALSPPPRPALAAQPAPAQTAAPLSVQPEPERQAKPETPPPAPKRVRVAIDPMQGRVAGDAHLLLVRSVQRGREALRQGLVLDRAALGRWLEQRALRDSGLASVARVRFAGADAPPSAAPAGDVFVFRHRFAEPFDPMAAELELVALPGVAGPGAIYALVGLLLLVGAGGLAALYRMVSVVVDFAERRSNFVAAVTHELKTPLTAIRMYAEMLRDGLVPGEAKKSEYYHTLTDESERLSRLIDNVLEFARLERGRRELSLRAGALGPVLEEAVAKLASHAAREGFALELAVEPDLPPVRFDRDALLQVLFNLVDNAMKYARGTGVRRVLLEARRAGAGVELAVRDFGPGVAPAHLGRIFEPFYRGEDELTRNTQGTGIGLALVRELAARMGAQVAGANLPEGGFRVSLAFAPAEA